MWNNILKGIGLCTCALHSFLLQSQRCLPQPRARARARARARVVVVVVDGDGDGQTECVKG